MSINNHLIFNGNVYIHAVTHSFYGLSKMRREESSLAKSMFYLYQKIITSGVNRFYYVFEKFAIPYASLKRHTYVLGTTGSGKSEQLKTFAYSRVTKRNNSFRTRLLQSVRKKNVRHNLVFIDPHGDTAHEIAQRKEHKNNKHFVYISPTLKGGYCPCINPFDIRYDDEIMLELIAQEITGIFSELLKDAALSVQMEALLMPCITTLLRKKDSSLWDLQRFMVDGINTDLIELGLKSINPAHRNFFEVGFVSGAYRTTKYSIYTKLQSLLNNSVFSNMTTRQTTIDIDKLLDEGNTIVVNLAKGEVGKEVSNALGRFIVGSITVTALRRAKKKGYRRPIHLMIDECHNYIGDSIETVLTEARKYGLYLTLANQNIWQIRDRSIRKTVLANTSVKCIGATSADSAKDLGMEIEIPRRKIQRAKTGEFYVKAARRRDAFLLRGPKKLLGTKNTMSKRKRKRIVELQVKRYYQSTKRNPEGSNLRLFYINTSVKDLEKELPVKLPRTEQKEQEEQEDSKHKRRDYVERDTDERREHYASI